MTQWRHAIHYRDLCRRGSNPVDLRTPADPPPTRPSRCLSPHRYQQKLSYVREFLKSVDRRARSPAPPLAPRAASRPSAPVARSGAQARLLGGARARLLEEHGGRRAVLRRGRRRPVRRVRPVQHHRQRGLDGDQRTQVRTPSCRAPRDLRCLCPTPPRGRSAGTRSCRSSSASVAGATRSS